MTVTIYRDYEIHSNRESVNHRLTYVGVYAPGGERLVHDYFPQKDPLEAAKRFIDRLGDRKFRVRYNRALHDREIRGL
jgi:hypothetical protein